MPTTTFTARGHKVRTQSHFRYQIVRVTAEKATPVGRSDNRAKAIERARDEYGPRTRADGTVEPIVVIDKETGEEIFGRPAPEATEAPAPARVERKKLADLTPDECVARVRTQSDRLEWAMGLQTCKNARAQWRRITGLGNDEFASHFESGLSYIEWEAKRVLDASPVFAGFSDETRATIAKNEPTRQLEVDPKVQAAKDLVAQREAQVAPAMAALNEASDAAHEVGMQILRLDDAGKEIPTELKEADEKATIEVDRKRRAYNNAEASLVAARRELERLTDPREVEKRTEQRLRLNNLKERNMAEKKATKSTAKDQGFPEVYLGENGNFKPGMDAAAKGDMFAAIIHVEHGGPVKKDARYDFTTEAGIALAKKLIEARGWKSLLAKSIAAAQGRAERAARQAEKKAEAKKAAPKKAPAKKAPAATGGDEVTPDPKPTPKPRTGRKVGR